MNWTQYWQYAALNLFLGLTPALIKGQYGMAGPGLRPGSA